MFQRRHRNNFTYPLGARFPTLDPATGAEWAAVRAVPGHWRQGWDRMLSAKPNEWSDFHNETHVEFRGLGELVGGAARREAFGARPWRRLAEYVYSLMVFWEDAGPEC